MREEATDPNRRKVQSVLLMPKSQLRIAAVTFGITFLVVSVLFGNVVYQVSHMINSLILLLPDSGEIRDSAASTKILLFGTYIFLVLSFLCCSVFLALTITHRYLGPMVAIRRHVKAMLAGDHTKRINLRKGDEFQDVADDLNELARRMGQEKSS